MRTPAVDFGFAFNDADFSDRVLCIELTSESVFNSNRKRKKPNTEKVVKVTTLNVNSLVLAAYSPFFFKLFKNGMKESQQKQVTMRINVSEEAALVDLLNFMYTNVLEANTAPGLLNVLVAADKFEVTCCIKYCSKLLKHMPLSLESALAYLELPPCDAAHPLQDAANKYLAQHFKDFTKSIEKAMELPLFALEVVLSIGYLKVKSEDHVFAFILDWGRAHYPNLKQRRRILTNRLARFIHFPYMSSGKLEELLLCPDFLHKQISKLVMESLHHNAGFPYGEGILVKEDLSITNLRHTIKRVYHYRPIKTVHLESPLPRCLVYFHLTKREVMSLYASCRSIYSQSFSIGERRFRLCVASRLECHQIGLYLLKDKGLQTCTVEFEFAATKKKPNESQRRLLKYRKHDLVRLSCGKWSMFDIPWANFDGYDPKYFINSILHLRAQIDYHKKQPGLTLIYYVNFLGQAVRQNNSLGKCFNFAFAYLDFLSAL